MTMLEYLSSLSGSDTDINLYLIDDVGSYTTSGRESGDAATSGEAASIPGNTALLTLIAAKYGRKTAGHELGHCLGLDHPLPGDNSIYRLMYRDALIWPDDYTAPKRFFKTESLFPNQ
jgi:hypothetical protein